MRSKQVVTPYAKASEGIGPGNPIEIADTPAPVHEVEVPLGVRALASGVGDGRYRMHHRLPFGCRLGLPAVSPRRLVGSFRGRRLEAIASAAAAAATTAAILPRRLGKGRIWPGRLAGLWVLGPIGDHAGRSGTRSEATPSPAASPRGACGLTAAIATTAAAGS